MSFMIDIAAVIIYDIWRTFCTIFTLCTNPLSIYSSTFSYWTFNNL